MTSDKLYRWQQFAYRILVTKEELEFSGHPEVVIEDALDAMIFKLKQDVLVEDLDPITVREVEIVRHTVPKTWWDHFKYTYKDKWWMPFKKFNITDLETEVTLSVTMNPMLAFPHAPFTPAKLSNYIRIRSIDEPIIFRK